MNSFWKKFITYFVFFGILSSVLFFIIKYFDGVGEITNWIITNKNYLIFLILSIVLYFSLRGENKIKTKFLINSLIFVNFSYLCYLFLVGNVGLTWQNSLLLIGLLIIGGFSFYMKNIFGYIIFSLCSIGAIIILFLSMIPLYEEGPDISGFEKNFTTKLLIYSDKPLNIYDALIEKDNNIIDIYQGLSVYDFKLKENPTKIVFKSKDLYENTFGFIVFPGGYFIQLNPQSAINIYDGFEIEVLAGNIGYYSETPTLFSFNNTGLNDNFSVYISENNNIVDEWYYENFKDYINKQLEGKIIKNKTIFKISKYTLNILSKIFPGKYDDNIKNLDTFLDILNINLETGGFIKATRNINSGFGKNTFNMFGNGLKNGMKNADSIDLKPGKKEY